MRGKRNARMESESAENEALEELREREALEECVRIRSTRNGRAVCHVCAKTEHKLRDECVRKRSGVIGERRVECT